MTKKANSKSRRKLLKQLAAGGGVAVTVKELPASWIKPVVESVLLPAHAGTSPCDESTTRITGFVTGAENGDFYFGGIYPLTNVSLITVDVVTNPSTYAYTIYDRDGAVPAQSRSDISSCGASPLSTISSPPNDANTEWAIVRVSSNEGTVGILGGGDNVGDGPPVAIDTGSIVIEPCCS